MEECCKETARRIFKDVFALGDGFQWYRQVSLGKRAFEYLKHKYLGCEGTEGHEYYLQKESR